MMVLVLEDIIVNMVFLVGIDIINLILIFGYNGGLENYFCFYENWGGRILIYRGFFVSIGLFEWVMG